MAQVGDTITKTLLQKYVESWDKAPGKVVYAEDSDRMKAGYDYYIFDAAEYANLLGSTTVGGTVKLSITGIAGSIETCTEGAQPQGGFRNNYYQCALIGKADEEGGDGENNGDDNNNGDDDGESSSSSSQSGEDN